jgi:hypothetical protein
VPELGPLGSVRGDRGNPVPYRDTPSASSLILSVCWLTSAMEFRRLTLCGTPQERLLFH